MPCGKKRKRHKWRHKRKKRLRKMRHKEMQ
jgi:hypothetical protein